MRKVLIFIAALVLVPAGSLFLVQKWVVKRAFVSAVEGLTGFKAEVDSLELDLIKGAVHIQHLMLLNPYEFKERIFADAPEIYLEIDLPRLLAGEKVHIRELRLVFREFNIEKSPRGVFNVSLLKGIKKTPASSQAEPGVKKPPMPFQLDRLELTLRRVRYHDRSGLVPKKFSADAKVDRQVFEGIRDAKSIIRVIIMKVISSTPFGNLGVNVVEIQQRVKSTVKTTRDLGEKVFVETGEELAQRGRRAGKIILVEGRETVDQVGADAKETITGLWGKVRPKLENREAAS